MVARKHVSTSVRVSGACDGVKGHTADVGSVGVAGKQYHMETLWKDREQDYRGELL